MDAPRADDLLQIDLQTDHEEQKDQSEFRNDRDGLLAFDETESGGADRESSYQNTPG